MKKLLLGLSILLASTTAPYAAEISVNTATNTATSKTSAVKLYNFTPELIKAAQNCTPYEEDFTKSNPNLTKSIPFMGKALSDVSIKINGYDEQGKCKFTVTQKVPGISNFLYDCAVTPEQQKALVSAMQDRSTTPVTETFTSYITITRGEQVEKQPMQQTMTDGKFNITWAKTVAESCQFDETEPSIEEKQALKDSMNNFSDSFMASLQKCQPDKEEKNLIIAKETFRIIGPDQDTCHLKYEGFDVYIPQKDLPNIKEVKNVTDLLGDEKFSRYTPIFDPEGLVNEVSNCPNITKAEESSSKRTQLRNIQIKDQIQTENNGTECVITLKNSLVIKGKTQNFTQTCRVDLKIIPELTQLITSDQQLLNILRDKNRCE